MNFEQHEIEQITGHPSIFWKIINSVEDIIPTFHMFIWVLPLTENHVEFTITEDGDIKNRVILTHAQARLMRVVLSTSVVDNLLIFEV